MNSTSQIWNRSPQLRNEGVLAAGSVGARIWSCVEYLWMGVTFMLFVVLGPFAAIAVVPAVFSLALQVDGPEPEKEVPAEEER